MNDPAQPGFPRPKSTERAADPVFVVGQPRSGSTITTRILNESADLFVVNDFYALQTIDAEKLWDRTDATAARRIAEIAFSRLEIRATQEQGKTLNQSIDLSGDAVAQLREFCLGAWPDGLAWHDVLGLVLSKAASLAGCQRWGWNTPQDHLHLERLFAAWPHAKVLFVLRHPAPVLSSYKNVSGPWHDARRYNPATIGLAWKVAANNFIRWREKRPDQVMLLRYEDLVADTSAMLKQVGQFLGEDFPSIDLAAFGRNSSHNQNRNGQKVKPAELWLAERIIGDSMVPIGFQRRTSRPSLDGLAGLTASMARSGAFIIGQILFDRDRRQRALNFLRRT